MSDLIHVLTSLILFIAIALTANANCITKEKMQVLVCEALCAQDGHPGGTWVEKNKKCACVLEMGPVDIIPTLKTNLSEPLFEYRGG